MCENFIQFSRICKNLLMFEPFIINRMDIISVLKPLKGEAKLNVSLVTGFSFSVPCGPQYLLWRIPSRRHWRKRKWSTINWVDFSSSNVGFHTIVGESEPERFDCSDNLIVQSLGLNLVFVAPEKASLLVPPNPLRFHNFDVYQADRCTWSPPCWE